MAQTRRNVALEKKSIRNLASCERKGKLPLSAGLSQSSQRPVFRAPQSMLSELGLQIGPTTAVHSLVGLEHPCKWPPLRCQVRNGLYSCAERVTPARQFEWPTNSLNAVDWTQLAS